MFTALFCSTAPDNPWWPCKCCAGLSARPITKTHPPKIGWAFTWAKHTALLDIQRWAGQGGEALFDNILVFENYPVAEVLEQAAPQGLQFGAMEQHEQTNYPLTLAIGLGEELSIHYAYDQAQFSHHSIEQIARHFANLLNAIVQDPQRRIAELNVLQAQEQQQIVQAWNPLAAAYPGERCIHERIAEQAALSPQAIAVTCGGENLSYQQLNQRANQLAHMLRERGVGPDVRVAVALERTPHMVVALLADTLVRVGNETYARENKSFGLTTLRNRHLALVAGGRVQMRFRGKSGQHHEVEIGDRQLAKQVRSIQQLPGLGEIHALAALADIGAALHLPLAPIHFALAMQGQAFMRRRGQQVGMAGRKKAILQQHAVLAQGL